MHGPTEGSYSSPRPTASIGGAEGAAGGVAGATDAEAAATAGANGASDTTAAAGVAGAAGVVDATGSGAAALGSAGTAVPLPVDFHTLSYGVTPCNASRDLSATILRCTNDAETPLTESSRAMVGPLANAGNVLALLQLASALRGASKARLARAE